MKKLNLAAYLTFLATALAVGVFLLGPRDNSLDSGLRALKDGQGEVAIKYLKPLAERGDKTAQYFMSTIYSYGYGNVPRNRENAIYWFRHLGSSGPVAVKEGSDPVAIYALEVARSYANGADGKYPDPSESAIWLKVAAEHGSKEAEKMIIENKQ